jgi:signal transduction histidine kinase
MNDHEKTDYDLLIECNELVESVLEKLPICVAIISPELTLLKANTLFFHLFGMQTPPSLHDLATTRLPDFQNTFWSDSRVTDYLLQNFQSTHFDFEREFVWETEGEKTRYISITSRILQHAPAKSSIMLTCADVTETRENERGRNEQIRFIMHELRNPLSNISLCVELLSDSIKENNQEDATLFLTKAANSVQRMKQLINDLNSVRQAS